MIKSPKKIGIFLGLALIFFYRTVLRPIFPSNCRYEPSCSEYSRQAILKYGLFVGMIKGIKRFSRCHPFSKHEKYDPLA